VVLAACPVALSAARGLLLRRQRPDMGVLSLLLSDPGALPHLLQVKARRCRLLARARATTRD
jgi:hypothetical protein